VAAGLGADRSDYLPGQALGYTLVVDNAGPDAAPAAQVVTALPAAYLGAAWTCTAMGGASCPPSGSGDLAESVNLPVGASATFAFSGTVAPGTSGLLSASATIAAGTGATDPAPGNNVDVLDLLPGALTIEIFADGFED
jgi:uncharacterized repeat protein (TIGR01451 family)